MFDNVEIIYNVLYLIMFPILGLLIWSVFKKKK